MTLKEIWKDVSSFEGLYQISNFGRVKSLPKKKGYGVGYIQREHIMQNSFNGEYYFVTLRKQNKSYRCYIHRLVASAFLENKAKKREVNHINGDKTDNRVVNLEWCTRSENAVHAWKTGLQRWTEESKEKKGRAVVCVDTGVEYYSATNASEHTGVDKRNIRSCCAGRRATAGGYKWAYKTPLLERSI